MQIDDGLTGILSARRGHFLLESGHHGDLWLDLESLCFRPERIRVLAGRLSDLLSNHDVEMVCGPLVEGAFVSLMVAEHLGLPFTYSQPHRSRDAGPLFPVSYRVPRALRERVAGRRVAIVNDVINAGSAVRGTLEDLRACGAEPVAMAALVVLGTAAGRLATENEVALERLCELPNAIWTPSECPLCAEGVPLSTP